MSEIPSNPQPERRAQCQNTPIMAEMMQLVEQVRKSVYTVDSMVRSHIHDHEVNQRALEQIVISIKDELSYTMQGFPNADPKAHREYHEAKIQELKTRAEFYRKMIFELSKAGLLGLFAWILVSLWQSMLHGPK